MANSASAAAVYEVFELEKNGNIVDITGTNPYGGKVTSFNYYESILSPNITAKITIADVGGSVPYSSEYDKQRRYGTLESALPLTGDVRVSCKITSPSGMGSLDFTRKPFVYDGHITADSKSTFQGMVVNLVSSTASRTKASVRKKYTGNIGNSVQRLLKDYVGNDVNVIVDSTSNSFNFKGENRSVVKTLCEVARQSSPLKGNPGYFFYETQRGLNFRSIDDLIKQDAYPFTYFKTEVYDESPFKIALKSTIKSDDISTLALSGGLRSENIFFDPVLYTVEHRIFDFAGLETSLGKTTEIPTAFAVPTHFHFLDIGTLDEGVSVKVNNDPREWQAKSKMRYNTLFSQIIQIQVPFNPQLSAGDTVNCSFEIVTQDKKNQGSSDPTTSGKYLICNLCHYISSGMSSTSMTLVHDSYGLHTNKNKA